MDEKWTEGMLIQIARDLELVKAALGIDRNEEGDIVRVLPPGEDARDIAARLGVRPWFEPGCPLCDTDQHRCPGCGTPVAHGQATCEQCARL
jgi:hypothetical protein